MLRIYNYRFDLGQNGKAVLAMSRPVARNPVKEICIARYIARFMKDVLGTNGHENEICQRSLEVEAANQTNAVELAKLMFCESENVKEWFLHADRVHIADADFPS